MSALSLTTGEAPSTNRPFVYTWPIDHFEALSLKNGEYLLSPTFTDPSGTTYWSGELYPNGYNSEDAGHLSIFLWLESRGLASLRATFTISLLDARGNRHHAVTFTEVFHENANLAWGNYQHLSREDLFKDAERLLSNGQLVIRFDVQIESMVHYIGTGGSGGGGCIGTKRTYDMAFASCLSPSVSLPSSPSLPLVMPSKHPRYHLMMNTLLPCEVTPPRRGGGLDAHEWFDEHVETVEVIELSEPQRYFLDQIIDWATTILFVRAVVGFLVIANKLLVEMSPISGDIENLMSKADDEQVEEEEEEDQSVVEEETEKGDISN